MKALFLCGGVGKRMAPLSEDKILLDFAGKTLLEHQLHMLVQAGLSDVIVVCNPLNQEKIQQIVGKFPGIKAELAVQKESLGIANALQSAAHLFDGELMIVNPNDLFEGSAYDALLAACASSRASAYLLGYKVVNSYFPGGYLVSNEAGQLTDIVEKPIEGHEPSDMVNLLVHIHREPRVLLDYISKVQTERDDVYEKAVEAMIKDGRIIRVVPYAGAWSAIKYPWHVLDGIHYFLDRAEGYIAPTAHISNRATIDGKVIIEGNARVLENAVIRGPVYIGPGTVVGNNTLVRGYSHIGGNCIVGFATEIKGSYVGDGCWFHMNYIGDSIVGERCNFGAGTITANWRFDEKTIAMRVGDNPIDTGKDKFGAVIGDNCRTGINVSIMPGVKIGANSVIGPAVCLTGDIEAGTTVIVRDRAKPIRRRPGTGPNGK